MGLIYRLSLRNLLRQKRRNLLLGIGIAFGMMILVMANSFSHGIVDVLINDIVANAFGHLVIDSHPGGTEYGLIRDKARYEKIIKETVKKEDLVGVYENLGVFGRAVGNGDTDNIVVVGSMFLNEADKEEFFKGFFSLVSGDFNEFSSPTIEYPVIISDQKAKSLNVKLHDVIRVKLPMITGQVQAAKLTVVAIANANNSFMDIVAFMEGERVKKLLGYKPWEAASLQLNLKDPKKTAPYYAELLHPKLNPEVISIAGKINQQQTQLLTFQNTDAAKKQLMESIKIISGDTTDSIKKDGVMVSEKLARKLNLRVGEEFYFEYRTKYRGIYQEKMKLSAVYLADNLLGGDVLLANAERVHDFFGRYLPEQNSNFIAKDNPLYGIQATEWKLLERSKDSEELEKKIKRERRIKTDQIKVDVITMYEGASDILKLEQVLNLITIFAGLILFFIILVGVVNTLRMTIRERTREIGTVRAIGMQKNDVRNIFIMETFLLTVISCIAGIILAVLAMWVLGSIQFNIDNALSMILKDKHLNFKINWMATLIIFIFITIISGLTAFFPARRAAKLSAVEALRHYE